MSSFAWRSCLVRANCALSLSCGLPRCPYGQALEIASGVAAGVGKRGGGGLVAGGVRLNWSRWTPVEDAAAYLYGLCGTWCVLSECLYVTAALHEIHAGGYLGGGRRGTYEALDKAAFDVVRYDGDRVKDCYRVTGTMVRRRVSEMCDCECVLCLFVFVHVCVWRRIKGLGCFGGITGGILHTHQPYVVSLAREHLRFPQATYDSDKSVDVTNSCGWMERGASAGGPAAEMVVWQRDVGRRWGRKITG